MKINRDGDKKYCAIELQEEDRQLSVYSDLPFIVCINNSQKFYVQSIEILGFDKYKEDFKK